MVNAWWLDAWIDGVNVAKSAIRNGLRDFGVSYYADPATVTGYNLAGAKAISVGGAAYVLDAADTGSAHAPPFVVVSLDGGRYKPKGREVLSAARNYFVRPDGNDNNTGLANTAGAAFLTLQRAADVVASLDVSVVGAIINVADGTYGPVLLKQPLGSASVVWQGNTTTPASVVIVATGAHAIAGASDVRNQDIRGFKLATTTGGDGILIDGGRVILREMEYGACAWSHKHALNNGIIQEFANYKITGASPYHNLTEDGGRVIGSTLTATLTGTPAFSQSFGYASRGAGILAAGYTYSGAATGKRYTCTKGGTIETFGGTLPGSIAGTADDTWNYS